MDKDAIIKMLNELRSSVTPDPTLARLNPKSSYYDLVNNRSVNVPQDAERRLTHILGQQPAFQIFHDTEHHTSPNSGGSCAEYFRVLARWLLAQSVSFRMKAVTGRKINVRRVGRVIFPR
jgi:hypothetical protein